MIELIYEFFEKDGKDHINILLYIDNELKKERIEVLGSDFLLLLGKKLDSFGYKLTIYGNNPHIEVEKTDEILRFIQSIFS